MSSSVVKEGKYFFCRERGTKKNKTKIQTFDSSWEFLFFPRTRKNENISLTPIKG